MDVSILERIDKSDIIIFDDIDISAIKQLYDNCIRLGDTNSNVEIATFHPNLWFEDFLNTFSKNIKIVISQPAFTLSVIKDGEFYQTNYLSETVKFSEENLIKFAEDIKYKKIALFYVNKCLNLRSLDVTWVIRYKDITNRQDERNLKIESIL
jgi:hypothetical protein